MSCSRLMFAVAVIGVSTLFGTRSRAAEQAIPGPTQEQAQWTQRFSEGVRLFKEEGKIEDALAIFREVFESTRSPNAALYIGHCLVKLERYVEANTAFSLTVREIGKRPDDKYEATREAAMAQLSWLSARIAKVVIALAEVPDGLVVEMDGVRVEPQSLGSELVVAPGQHRIEARAPGMKPVSRAVEAAAGETKTISFAFQSLNNEAQPSSAPRDRGEVGDRRTLYRILGFSAAGVGLAGLSVFTVAGLGAKSTYRGLEEDCRTGCADASRRVDLGKSQQTWANVGLSVGAVGLAASGLLLYLGFSQSPERSVSFEVTPGKTSVSYRGIF